MYNKKRMRSSLSELTPIISNMDLTYLSSKASKSYITNIVKCLKSQFKPVVKKYKKNYNLIYI